MTTLSAWDHRLGETYTFAGREIRMVSAVNRNALDIPGYAPEQEEVNIDHLAPNKSLLTYDDTLTVKRYGEGQLTVLLEALDLWAGTTTERTRSDWMEFYLEVWLPQQS